jgi:hypothetical protein
MIRMPMLGPWSAVSDMEATMAPRSSWHQVKGRWTRTLGEHGFRVRLFQKRKGGTFCRDVWSRSSAKIAGACIRPIAPKQNDWRALFFPRECVTSTWRRHPACSRWVCCGIVSVTSLRIFSTTRSGAGVTLRCALQH